MSYRVLLLAMAASCIESLQSECQEPAAARSASGRAAAGGCLTEVRAVWAYATAVAAAASSASQTSGTDSMGLQECMPIQYSPVGMRLLWEAAPLSQTQRGPTVTCLCGALESPDSESA